MSRRQSVEVENEELPTQPPSLSILDLSQEEVEGAVGFHPVELESPTVYPMSVSRIIYKFSKKGSPMLRISCRPLDDEDPLIETIITYTNLPFQNMKREQREMRNLALKELATSLNQNIGEFLSVIQSAHSEITEETAFEGVEIEDFRDLLGHAIITYEEASTYKDEDGVLHESPARNNVKRWIIANG